MEWKTRIWHPSGCRWDLKPAAGKITWEEIIGGEEKRSEIQYVKMRNRSTINERMKKCFTEAGRERRGDTWIPNKKYI